MPELITADLVREVEETRGVARSAVAFISGLSVQLQDLKETLANLPDSNPAPGDPEVDVNAEAQRIVDEAITSLNETQAEIAAAIAANPEEESPQGSEGTEGAQPEVEAPATPGDPSPDDPDGDGFTDA